MRLVRRAFVAVAVTCLVLSSGGVAVADDLVADGDRVAPFGNNDLALGVLCVSREPVQVSVPVVVDRQGNAGNVNDPHRVFGNGATVTFSVTSVTDTRLSASMATTPSQVTLPTDWTRRNTGASAAVTSTVSVDVSTTGDFTGVVTYSATGTEETGGSLTLTDAMTVTGTVSDTGSCAPAAPNRAPVVTVTGVVAGHAYEYGAGPTPGCSWTDDSDGSGTATPVVTGPEGARAAAGLGAFSVTCSKTDSGTPALTGTATATYTIVDTTAPVIPALGDVAAAAVDQTGAVVEYTVPTATDAVDGSVPLSCSPASATRFPLGSTTVTCGAADVEGNRAGAAFVVRVTDQTAPVLTVPSSITLDATSAAGAVGTYTASARDNVDGALTPTCTPGTGTTFGFGTTVVRCTATDAARNTGAASFTVTVQDRTAPELRLPAPDPVEATGPGGAPVTWAPATAVDDIDGPTPVTCGRSSGETFPITVTEVTCSATDSHENTSTGSFLVEVRDTTAPRITVPGDLTVEASSSTGAVVDLTGLVSAVDVVDGPVGVTCTPTSGSFGFGATLVTCTSGDRRRNSATRSFTVTVVDTTPPALPRFTNLAGIEATGPGGAPVGYTVDSAQDVVDGLVPVHCEPASDTTFPLGTTTVGCSASDAAGNEARGSFTVQVVDTTAPRVGDVVVPTTEATGPGGAQVSFVVTATDLVDADPSVACDRESGSWFPLGTTSVTCRATDDSGNWAERRFAVTVADTTAPRVDSLPNATLEATSAAGATYVYETPSATDAVDGAVDVACAPATGATLPLGETQVTCSATDRADNTGHSAWYVTVQDTTAPTLGSVPNAAATATSASGAVVSYDLPTVEDAVDAAVDLTCSKGSGTTFPLGVTQVTCTATDDAGNSASTSFTVTVEVAWSGLLAPVDLASSRTYKAGSTIPVRFQLTGVSARVTGLPARLYVRRVGAGAAGEVVATSTSQASVGNLFRYESSSGQYSFTLGTRGLSPGSYELRVDLGDSAVRVTPITLR